MGGVVGASESGRKVGIRARNSFDHRRMRAPTGMPRTPNSPAHLRSKRIRSIAETDGDSRRRPPAYGAEVFGNFSGVSSRAVDPLHEALFSSPRQ